MSSIFTGRTVLFLRECPLSLTNWPFKLQSGLSGPLRIGASRLGIFKVRSLRGFSRQKIKEMPSAKSLPYS